MEIVEKNDNLNSALSKQDDEIVIYQTEDGAIKVDVLFAKETVWLSMEQMGRLFGKSRTTILGHIQNIYEEGELVEANTMRKVGNPDFSTKPTSMYRANASLPQMGLTSTERQGKVLRTDIGVGKNYLNEDEMALLLAEQHLESIKELDEHLKQLLPDNKE